jgi:transcriptional regulator with XRE-family HTH domain
MARQRLSQSVFAARMGWSQQMLSARLTGITDFSVAELGAVADMLGVPVAQLASPAAREMTA